MSRRTRLSSQASGELTAGIQRRPRRPVSVRQSVGIVTCGPWGALARVANGWNRREPHDAAAAAGFTREMSSYLYIQRC